MSKLSILGVERTPEISTFQVEESQETAHTNSYTIDTTSKYSICHFQYENGWSLLIKLLLKAIARLKVANLGNHFFAKKLTLEI